LSVIVQSQVRVRAPFTYLSVSLAAELAFGGDFPGHARHFRGERSKLIDHRVDRVLEFEDFTAHINRDLFG
jgi:hypothetical protein